MITNAFDNLLSSHLSRKLDRSQRFFQLDQSDTGVYIANKTCDGIRQPCDFQKRMVCVSALRRHDLIVIDPANCNMATIRKTHLFQQHR